MNGRKVSRPLYGGVDFDREIGGFPRPCRLPTLHLRTSELAESSPASPPDGA